MRTFILTDPLISLDVGPDKTKPSRRLPSVELVKNITDSGDRIVIVDSQINRKMAKSALIRYPEYENIDDLKNLAILNYKFTIVDKSPQAWDWKIEGEDVRNSTDEVVYVDYSVIPQLPAEINDELFVMYTVGDYKWKNRSYMRNVEYDNLTSIKNEASPYFDWRIKGDDDDVWEEEREQHGWIELNRKMYSMVCKCIAYYMENDFLSEIPELPMGILQANIICSKDPLSYPLNLNHPALEGFVYTYDIMPPPPDGKYAKSWTEDRFAYVSTGITPSYLMRSSTQYRQVFSKTLKRVMTYLLENSGVKFDPESIESWKEVANQLDA